MRWRGAGLTAALAGAALLWRLRPFRVEVRGRSMEPSLRPGEFLVAVRARTVRRGDVVVVAHPTRRFEVVKRVAALPGDRLRRDRGVLWVGNRAVEAPGAAGGAPGEWTLPADRYLVLGDNLAASTDGRAFGPVPGSAIAGRAVLRYWPRPGRVR